MCIVRFKLTYYSNITTGDKHMYHVAMIMTRLDTTLARTHTHTHIYIYLSYGLIIRLHSQVWEK